MLGGIERRDARFHVAPVLARNAAVGEEDFQECFVHHTLTEQLARRDADAFLLNLVARRRDAARHFAADVRGVNERPRPAHQPTFVKDRFPEEHVREVGGHAARCFGIVGDEDVAFAEIVADGFDGVVHRHRQHRQHAITAR